MTTYPLVVADSATGTPMGCFYLDMFPREGKFNHFACFPQKLGALGTDGRYELPVAALICNFPPPTPGKPSLLSHGDVETLFHEFGHVMHGMLSRARFRRQLAFSVPRDFVEAPSQMLENFVWDPAILKKISSNAGSGEPLPDAMIASMNAARHYNQAWTQIGSDIFYAIVDQRLHLFPGPIACAD